MVDIDAIVIGERYRKDFGDIEGLAASIADLGLLQPIVVTPDRRLIAGERRLAAFRLLGRTQIEAVEVDLDDVIRGEWAENNERKAFTRSEAVEIGEALLGRERIAAELRKAASQAKPGTQIGADKLSAPIGKGDSRDIVGKAVGMSGGTFYRAREVVQAAREEPERFEPIKEEMDRTGNVTAAYRRMNEVRAEPPQQPAALSKSAGAVAARDQQIKRMASDGYRVASIADAVGMTEELIRRKLRDWGIQSADEKLGRGRRVRAEQVLSSLIEACTPAAEAIELIESDWDHLDRGRFKEWDELLSAAMEPLRRLQRRLRAS